jgi:hypothetical protein
MNVSELAEQDLAMTMESTDASGSPFTLIDPDNNEYPVVGTVGDISLLIEPESGEKIRSRSIACSCRMRTLGKLTGKKPARGWKARLTDLQGNSVDVYIAGCDPDGTMGVYNLTMSLDLEDEDDE